MLQKILNKILLILKKKRKVETKIIHLYIIKMYLMKTITRVDENDEVWFDATQRFT